jgi:hypothetical protein
MLLIAILEASTEFQFDVIWYTTLNDNEVKTGRESKQNTDKNAIEDFDKSKEYSIPDQVINDGKTYNVVEIGYKSFRFCSYINFKYITTNIIKVSDFGLDTTRLTSFPNLPNLEYIGYLGFASCSFTSVEIPSTVQYIGASAFSYCPNLAKITISNNYYIIDKYGALYNYQKTELIWVPSSLEEINLPLSLQTISDRAFMYSKLTEVYIPPLCDTLFLHQSRKFSF